MHFPNQESLIDSIIFSLFAAFAGLLGYIMRNVNNRRKVTWQRSLLEASASGFVGFLTVMLCRAIHVSYEWTGFMSGVLGWLGATTSIQLFERVIRRKLGLDNVDLDNPETDAPKGDAHSPANSADGGTAG